MLTLKDLDEIEKLTRTVVKEEIKHLPSKNEFFSRMDKLTKEIKD